MAQYYFSKGLHFLKYAKKYFRVYAFHLATLTDLFNS